MKSLLLTVVVCLALVANAQVPQRKKAVSVPQSSGSYVEKVESPTPKVDKNPQESESKVSDPSTLPQEKQEEQEKKENSQQNPDEGVSNENPFANPPSDETISAPANISSSGEQPPATPSADVPRTDLSKMEVTRPNIQFNQTFEMDQKLPELKEPVRDQTMIIGAWVGFAIAVLAGILLWIKLWYKP